MDPGGRPTHTVVVSHVQNTGRLAQMLAQGQSSSPKKRKKKKLTEKIKKAWPYGPVVEVLSAPLGQSGFAGLDPRHGSAPLISQAVEASHIQSRGRLAWMLPQGLFSSSKKKKKEKEDLALDFSSGRIFLNKNQKNLIHIIHQLYLKKIN